MLSTVTTHVHCKCVVQITNTSASAKDKQIAAAFEGTCEICPSSTYKDANMELRSYPNFERETKS